MGCGYREWEVDIGRGETDIGRGETGIGRGEMGREMGCGYREWEVEICKLEMYTRELEMEMEKWKLACQVKGNY